MEPIRFALNSYFLHKKLLFSILDPSAGNRFEKKIQAIQGVDNHHRSLILDRALTEEGLRLIQARKIQKLEVALVSRQLHEGQLVTFERTFYFKGVTKALRDHGRGVKTYAEFYVKLPEFDGARIAGRYSPEHFTCNSAAERLSRQNRVFMLAHIDKITKAEVDLRPIIIADRVLADRDILAIPNDDCCRVRPEEIDEFQSMLPANVHVDIAEMQKYPEAKVKAWFAEVTSSV